MPDAPFNPLDKLNLAESLAEAMLKRPVGPLPPQEKFDGAGIYAIYYVGDFGPYSHIAKKNQGKEPTSPIYVGKAVPPGAERAGSDLEWTHVMPFSSGSGSTRNRSRRRDT